MQSRSRLTLTFALLACGFLFIQPGDAETPVPCVTEDDSGVLGVKLSMTARLTSPSSADYDVFVYVNTGSDTVECTTPSGTGTADEKYLLWGEGSISNGSDDGRTVSVEVRPVSGACTPSQPWQLVLIGDT